MQSLIKVIPKDTVKQTVVKHFLTVQNNLPEKTLTDKTIEYGGLLATLVLAFVALRSLRFNKNQAAIAIKAVEAQTDAMEQENKKFKIENSCFLLVKNVNFETKNKFPHQKGELVSLYIKFEYQNFGKHPVRITSQRFLVSQIQVDGYIFPIDETRIIGNLSNEEYKPYSAYIIGDVLSEFKIERTITAPDNPTHYNVDKFLYFSGEVKYINVITNIEATYVFCVIIKAFNTINYQLFYSAIED